MIGNSLLKFFRNTKVMLRCKIYKNHIIMNYSKPPKNFKDKVSGLNDVLEQK